MSDHDITYESFNSFCDCWACDPPGLRPIKDWNQVDMVEFYEDLCNGCEIISYEISVETKERLTEWAHRERKTFNKAFTDFLTENADKIIKSFEKEAVFGDPKSLDEAVEKFKQQYQSYYGVLDINAGDKKIIVALSGECTKDILPISYFGWDVEYVTEEGYPIKDKDEGNQDDSSVQ